MAPTTLPPLDQVDPVEAWQPWEPSAKDPWNLQWAGHLYRRAAFGASPAEMNEAAARGLPATLDQLIKGTPDADNIDQMLVTVGAQAADRSNPFELRAWWLYAMLNSGRPVQEKMVLFWHNHFATSINKVQRTTWMFNQNRLLRKYALGKFGPFLHDMSRDVAMIVWLDNNSNLKAHPNENYAREVMELFSLGVGHYTEKDIREAARAFTGWHTNGGEYDFNARFHDDGEKTVLGQTGAWNGDEVLDILLKRSDCAEFLTRKLYRYFVSEQHDPPAKLIAPLAEAFRKTDYDIADLVRRILSSKHFFSAYAYRQKIKCPVEYVLGAVKTIYDQKSAPEGKPPPTLPLVSRLEVMGQQLFAPPNVKGWPGGQSWLNTSTVLARVNFAQALVMGTLWSDTSRGETPNDVSFQPPGIPGQPDVKTPEEPPPEEYEDTARLIRQAKATKADEVVRVLIDALLPGGVSDSARTKLTTFVADGKPTGDKLDRRTREAAHAILSMPEYQLA
ncbi:MAG TPA: DUF1800 domain-containing protein [Gemmataceae bacterium]|nr:DUF1800 domain-containing protein [Gemmataceae bacterium]